MSVRNVSIGIMSNQKGYMQLSLKIPNVESNVDVLIGENHTLKLKIRVVIIECK